MRPQALKGGVGATTQTSVDLGQKQGFMRGSWGLSIFVWRWSYFLFLNKQLDERFQGCLKKSRDDSLAQGAPRADNKPYVNEQNNTNKNNNQ